MTTTLLPHAAVDPIAEIRRLASQIPFPLFFVGGALLGILLAMAIVISVQGMPKTKMNADAPPQMQAQVQVVQMGPPSTASVQQAHVLFVFRPQLVATRSASPSPIAEAPIAATAPTRPAMRTVAVNRPRAERQQTSAVPANLLSAGL